MLQHSLTSLSLFEAFSFFPFFFIGENLLLGACLGLYPQKLPADMIKRVTLVYLYHVNRCGHHKKIVDCKVGLCASLRTVAELLQQYSP